MNLTDFQLKQENERLKSQVSQLEERKKQIQKSLKRATERYYRRLEQYDSLKESMLQRKQIKSEIWEYERKCGQRGRQEPPEPKPDKNQFKKKFQDKMRQFLETKKMEESLMSEQLENELSQRKKLGYMSRYKEMSRKMYGEPDESDEHLEKVDLPKIRKESHDRISDFERISHNKYYNDNYIKNKSNLDKRNISNIDLDADHKIKEYKKKYRNSKREDQNYTRNQNEFEKSEDQSYSRERSINSNERSRIRDMLLKKVSKRLDSGSSRERYDISESPKSKRIRPIGRYKQEYDREKYQRRHVRSPGYIDDLYMKKTRQSIKNKYDDRNFHREMRRNRDLSGSKSPNEYQNYKYSKKKIEYNPETQFSKHLSKNNYYKDEFKKYVDRNEIEYSNNKKSDWRDYKEGRKFSRWNERNYNSKKNSLSPNKSNLSGKKNRYMNNYLKMARMKARNF